VDHVERLKRILDVGGFTQLVLAERIGVSHVSLNAWMNGRAVPRKSAQRTIDRLYAEVVSANHLTNYDATVFSSAQIEALAQGKGGREVVRILRDSRRREVAARIEMIFEMAPSSAASRDLLARAEAHDNDAYAEMLQYPHVGVWSARCLDALLEERSEPHAAPHLAHLAAVAATTAWKCGVQDFEIDIEVDERAVMLPGLGRVMLGDDPKRSTIRCREGRLSVVTSASSVDLPDDLERSAHNWHPLRTIVARHDDLELRIAFDDIDPYRGQKSSLGIVSSAQRIESVDFKRWVEVINEAWSLLVDRHRERALEIAEGVCTVVPLDDHVRWLTGFYRDGFGAVLSTMPQSEQAFALTLIEEFQRMKVSALHLVQPLHEAGSSSRFYAPWSLAPLDGQGLVEGFYSTASTLEFSQYQCESSIGEQWSEWASQWCTRLSWEASAYLRLLHMGELTPFGSALRDALHESVTRDRPSPPREVMAFVRRLAIDRWMCFRLGYIRLPNEEVSRLAHAWTAGMACPLDDLGVEFVTNAPQALSGWKLRRRLGEVRLAHPDSFDDLLQNRHYRELVVPESSAADASLVAERFEEAIGLYTATLEADVADLEAWAGLAAAVNQAGVNGISTLGRFPEIVAFVSCEIRRRYDLTVDPLQLARWLEPLLMKIDDMGFEAAADPNDNSS
jgi:HEXXH motif-containing protein